MNGRPRGKVVVAMSGGVDSSVAAALLQREGYDVVGCFLRLGTAEEPGDAPACAADPPAAAAHRAPSRGCCSVNDAHDARLVASILGVPLYVLNFREDFARVIDYFVREYNAGRTPNPCVRCNDWLKFGKLEAYARGVGADFIASGHYARVTPADPAQGPAGGAGPAAFPSRLRRALDDAKDQSYVLFGLRPEVLGRLLLPVGGYRKAQVRELARQWGLPVSDKPDSQEICFVPDDDYAGLIRRRTPQALGPGDIVDAAGRVLGRHAGQQHFTVGQRRGVGLALGHPVYVVDKDPRTNTVTVGGKDELLAAGLLADEANWLAPLPQPPGAGPSPIPCHVRIRYNSPAVPATLQTAGGTSFAVRFAQPQAAVTPGQAAVIYDGDVVLGGGWIRAVVRN